MGKNSFTPLREHQDRTPRSGKKEPITNLMISHSMNRLDPPKRAALQPPKGSSARKKKYKRSVSQGTGIGGLKKMRKSINNNLMNSSHQTNDVTEAMIDSSQNRAPSAVHEKVVTTLRREKEQFQKALSTEKNTRVQLEEVSLD